MTLRLPDKWVWDFWLAQDGPDYHIFYLQAPRSLSDPDLRHWNVSVGHAVSQNLRDWGILPDALRPSSNGDLGRLHYLDRQCHPARGAVVSLLYRG